MWKGISMNDFLINLMERIKDNSLDEETFFATIRNWRLIQSWYYKYGIQSSISDHKLLDLVYFLYTHESLDFYVPEHFSQISVYLAQEYGIEKRKLIDAFEEYRAIMYGFPGGVRE